MKRQVANLPALRKSDYENDLRDVSEIQVVFSLPRHIRAHHLYVLRSHSSYANFQESPWRV